MPKTTTITMDDLLAGSPVKTLEAGDLVEGKVQNTTRHQVWLDLGVYGIGLVMRRDVGFDQEIKEGGTVSVTVVDPESMFGFPILSFKKVTKEQGWEYLEVIYKSGETVSVKPYDANRGGLLIEIEGIRGFLPVSQLAANHYPRVSNADKDEILQRLNDLTNQELEVKILDLNRDENKLIVSEKEVLRQDTKAMLEKLKIGDVVEGEVTGVVDFGIFVTVDGIEGLVHISEISWDRVTNPNAHVKVSDKIKAKIIAIDDNKLSLSIKQLSKDPWLDEVKKFKVGEVAEGTITRITPFGAFVQLTSAVEALVHISELGLDKEQDLKTAFSVDEKRKFKVIDIDTEARKISLSLKDLDNGTKKPKTKQVTDKSKS